MTTNALWRRTAVACALLVTAGACASGGGETADTASAAAEMTATTSAMRRVLIDTDAGPITVEINETAAPVTAANFMQYVTDARYDGGAFYRVVTMQNQPTSPIKIEVIQGGVDGDSTKMLPPIAHETNERASHEPKSSRDVRLRHVPGCSCCSSGATRRGGTVRLANGAKTFPGKRPWQISH